MTVRIAIVTLAVVLCSDAAAAQDSAFVRALKANASEMSVTGGKLQGRGADLIAREARADQFILVGEDHGIREVPQFVGALFETVRPEGYSHIAVEVGPQTTRTLETMMRSPTAQSDLDAFLARYTAFTIPFFFWREEAQMLERVVKSVPGRNDVVWGLDQEFVMAPTYMFEKLATLATTDRARALARKLAVSSAAADKAMIATRNPTAVWMFSATDADVAGLRDAFGPNPPAAAKNIIDELAVSRDIYRTFNSGRNYEANQERADLMKRHLVEQYRSAQARGERRPKAVIKLGANHVFRGPSITNSYEIGSFAPEFALSEGGRAFSILLVVKRGTSNEFRPFGSEESDKTKPYDLLTSEEYSVFDMQSVVAAASDTSLTLIDLRPERSMLGGSLKRLGPTGRRLLSSFDAVVVVPEGHASVYIRN